MSKWKQRVWFIFIIILIGGCAPTTKRADLNENAVKLEAQKQKEIALQSIISKQERLMRVGYPILSSAITLCEDHIKPSTGIWFANKYVFPKDFRDAASNNYKLGEQLKILYVIPNSPAAAAGLTADDVLLTVNAKTAPAGDKAVESLQKLFDEKLTTGKVVTLRFSRAGTTSSTELIPIDVCDYPVVLNESDDVNAFADGKKIAITKGMIRFAETDQELALVISHELAHNAMGHINAKLGNYALGSVVDIVAAAYGINTQSAFGNMAAQAYSKEFEAEADYVGLYIMAMAGLKIDNAANFWRRMAAEHPGSIKSDYGSTHPSTPERFVGLEQTIDEINIKQASNLPLLPEYTE